MQLTIKPSIFLVKKLIFYSCDNNPSKNKYKTELDTKSKIVKSEKPILKDSIIYLSGENDSALIKLSLIPNGTFNFYMNIISENNQNSESDIINSRGLWIENEEKLLLNFSKKEKLNLNSIFNSENGGGNEFKVDLNTVEIDYTLDEINIWGIQCHKVKN